MRTLTSTFSTRDEAEAASRRLAAIGIARERIILKDVAPTAEASAGAGAAGGVFISVKVTTEQVQPASEILKGRPSAGIEAPPALRAGAEEASPPAPAPVEPELPAPPWQSEAAPAAIPPHVQTQPQQPPGTKELLDRDRSRLGRYVIYYCLALVAAFVIGAWLGQLG